MKPPDLLGAWALVSCTRYTEGSTWDHPLGPKPTGLILYTPDGFMSAFIHKDPAMSWSGPLLAAYAGRWAINNDSVRHEVRYNTDAGRAGSTLVRHARFEGSLLILQTEKKAGPSGVSWMDFAWTRP